MPNDADEYQRNSVDAQFHSRSSSSEEVTAKHASTNDEGKSNGEATTEYEGMEQSREMTPPPLPPRPNLDLLDERAQTKGSLRLPKRGSRPQLLSKATTALSYVGAGTQAHRDGQSMQSSPASRATSRRQSFVGRFASQNRSDGDDSNSIVSFAPTLGAAGDMESLLGDVATDQASPAWRSLSAQIERDDPFKHVTLEDDLYSLRIRHEFDELEAYVADSSNEGRQVSRSTRTIGSFNAQKIF